MKVEKEGDIGDHKDINTRKQRVKTNEYIDEKCTNEIEK